MWSLLNNWIGWLGLGASLSALAAFIAGISWIPGVGTLLSIATAGLTMIAPLVNGVLSALVWIWSTVLWPGILDILDSWATIFTVIIICGMTYFGLAARYEVRHIRDTYTINKCVTPTEAPETELELPWPFKWKF